MVTGEFSLTNPDDVEASMTLTMTVREWKHLRAQLGSEHPSWKIDDIILDLVNQAEEKFTPSDALLAARSEGAA